MNPDTPNQSTIAIAGTQWITADLIKRLIQMGHTPALVIGLGDEHKEAICGYENLGPLCDQHGITFYRPHSYSLNDEKDQEFLGKHHIDALLVFGWQRLIPEWLIEHCKRQVFGVHGGPEPPPKCRGRAVFNWALIQGATKFYHYLFRITAEVDAGEILEMVSFDITAHDDITSLYHKNCVVTSRMIRKHLPAILNHQVLTTPQPNTEASYLPKRTPQDSAIDWTQSAKDITNLIRAVAPPYPAAFSHIDGVKISIHRAHVFDTNITYPYDKGTIAEVFLNQDFVVTTGDVPLYVREFCCDDDSVIRVQKRFCRKASSP